MGVLYWISCARHQETFDIGKNQIYVRRRVVDGVAILEAFRREMALGQAVHTTLPERKGEKESRTRLEQMVVAFVRRHDGCRFLVRNDWQDQGLFPQREIRGHHELEFSNNEDDVGWGLWPEESGNAGRAYANAIGRHESVFEDEERWAMEIRQSEGEGNRGPWLAEELRHREFLRRGLVGCPYPGWPSEYVDMLRLIETEPLAPERPPKKHFWQRG